MTFLRRGNFPFKRKGPAGLFFFMVVLAAGLALAAADRPLRTMIPIDNRNYYDDKERGRVDFPHEKHMQMVYGCTACHHDYRGPINILKLDELRPGGSLARCITCHGHYGKARHRHGLPQAYHSLCMSCHKKDSGPVLCGACHRQGQKK